ncbi:MAG TPA: prolyl oligopeptidase family serine peptidase [Longimicrobiales bacterium]|nr:prolyl oligopeptidase family serine peptidase [Longimicrobiales bacterium]
MRTARRFGSITACCILFLSPALARAQGTLEDYRRAQGTNQRFARLFTGIVQGGVSWIGESNQFTYRVSVAGGSQFMLVDATTGARRPAFDHERLAAVLAAATSGSYTAVTLPFNAFTFMDGALNAIEAEFNNARWRCTLLDYVCTRAPGGAPAGTGGGGPGGPTATASILSADRSMEACVRNHNVAVRPVPGAGGPGGARPCTNDPGAILLSVDGSEGDAYQLQSMVWSPDGRKLVVYRRRPGYRRIVNFVRSSPTDQVQPRHETSLTLGSPNSFYAKPGDLLDFHQPVLFDITARTGIALDRSLFPNPYAISRAVWREDGRAYTFEYNQRGHQVFRVLEVNAESGAVRPLINEETKTFFAYRPASAGLSDTGHRYRRDLADGREIIWMSERDGWAHLYLYDGQTGRVKNQITRGEWLVKAVDSVDVANRHIYFRAVGMNRDQDPYFIHFYRIDFDGSGLIAYTEANGTHDIRWSTDRQYYVDTYSRVDLPPVLELRRARDRSIIAQLEKGDMSAALAAGFRPPEVFVAKGRDGVTDIWGIIVRPHSFDAARRYPVIEQIYAGPQGSFVPKSWGGGQGLAATAELGFILVQIDGMGTNNRSKAFHDVAWQNLGDAGFPDRILWHRAVHAKYSWYDIERVGVYGGSAGGQNALGAVLFHGDFYDAAFASSGCHDNRMDKIWWNEHWMGELGPHYAAQSNVTNAHRLTGALFLAVGELDTNVDPASTMQVVDALIRAGKDFELLVVPNGGHGATGPDGTRRRNDFFVRHLLGVSPPDWNAGITLAPAGSGLDVEEPPPYGFFETPDDSTPPYWWW